MLTKDGFPSLADIYPAATPVPCFAVYTPKASNESPAAAAVILSQSENINEGFIIIEKAQKNQDPFITAIVTHYLLLLYLEEKLELQLPTLNQLFLFLPKQCFYFLWPAIEFFPDLNLDFHVQL